MKNVGSEIDKVLHQELLESFIKFIEYFSPVLTKAEEYKMHVISENLIESPSLEMLEIVPLNCWVIVPPRSVII